MKQFPLLVFENFEANNTNVILEHRVNLHFLIKIRIFCNFYSVIEIFKYNNYRKLQFMLKFGKCAFL
jgi:hypothetical protein